MAPKNKKKNSFFFFMKEMQEREAAKGCNISMMNMPNLAHPIWAKLSLAEREPYEELARKHKNDPNLRGGKLASDGTRVEDNLREIEEIERKENQMIQNIKNYVNVDCISEDHFREFASKKMFYFISFNILCHTETEYIPIEVGVVEYSIQHGINREYHRILNPGRIPTGYTGEAKRISEDKHKIDIFGGTKSAEKDVVSVFNGLKDFIVPQYMDEYPPLFCQEEDLEQTRGCLEWLALRTRSGEEFDVWNAKYLLMELRAGVGEAFPSQVTAADLLSKSSFNYHPAARCDFHVEEDSPYCALAFSKRLCYLLSDAVCQQFDVMLTDRHMPSLCEEEKGYIVSNFNNVASYKKGPAPVVDIRLDQSSNYYRNDLSQSRQFEDVSETASVPKVKPAPRQPVSNCIAAEMTRLKLNTSTASSVPGHGIGRGIRRTN